MECLTDKKSPCERAHLDDEVVAEVEGSHCVDEQDLLVVVQTHPRDALQQFWFSCEARQHLDLFWTHTI